MRLVRDLFGTELFEQLRIIHWRNNSAASAEDTLDITHYIAKAFGIIRKAFTSIKTGI